LFFIAFYRNIKAQKKPLMILSPTGGLFGKLLTIKQVLAIS
jgi:hypothetical protein